MNLINKSIHKLRAIAQAYGVKNILSMDDKQLMQAISLKQNADIPADSKPIVTFEVSAETWTNFANKRLIRDIFQPYVDRGLRLSFPDKDTWHISCRGKEDTGNMTMPVWSIVACAERLMG